MASLSNDSLKQGRLFLTLLILLWGLIICFVAFQYSSERRHKIELIDVQLQQFNAFMCDLMAEGVSPSEVFDDKGYSVDNLEIEIIAKDGSIIYDSTGKATQMAGWEMPDDVVEAFKDGKGHSIEKAKSRGEIGAFYSSTRCGNRVIRSMQPYNMTISDVLKVGNGFLTIAIIISVIISLLGYITSMLFTRLERTNSELEQEQVSALREAQEKVRIKRQLTNNINHELKTPICSILGYLEMVINNPSLDPDMCHNFVKKSYDQAERLRSLMADLSTITRIDEASAMIECESLSLSKMILDLVDDVMPQADKQNMRIIAEFGSELNIVGNQSLLYSVFRNLVDNSIAYSGGRHIWIELLSQDDDQYKFSIRDNGIGVEPKHLPHLFERFYRVDSGRSRKLGGTGLGLSIVKNAVMFHGGTIDARLCDMGGLEFIFTLNKGEL